MKILLAIFLPPAAVLMCGKPGAAIVNVFLCFVLWIPAVIHAISIVNSCEADRRVAGLAKAIGQANRPVKR